MTNTGKRTGNGTGNENAVHVIGGGLAGSEAAFQIAARGVPVILHEMRPVRMLSLILI